MYINNCTFSTLHCRSGLRSNRPCELPWATGSGTATWRRSKVTLARQSSRTLSTSAGCSSWTSSSSPSGSDSSLSQTPSTSPWKIHRGPPLSSLAPTLSPTTHSRRVPMTPPPPTAITYSTSSRPVPHTPAQPSPTRRRSASGPAELAKVSSTTLNRTSRIERLQPQ